MTLVEFLVVIGMMLILLGAVIPTLFATTNQGNRQAERITSLDASRVTLERMTRELRQASQVVSATGQVLNFNVWSTGGTEHSIRYDCGQPGTTAGQFKCVRSNLTLGGSRTEIDGVLNSSSPPPFAYTAAATNGRPRIQIELQTQPESASRPVVLRNEATLRVPVA